MEITPKGVQLTVRMKDGSKFTAFANSFKGGKGKELTKEEIDDKFRGNVAFSKIVTKENAEKALNMLDHLEEIENVGDIARLLITKGRGV